MKNKLITQILILFILSAFTSSCSRSTTAFSYADVTDMPKLQHLNQQCLRLKKDVFLIKVDGEYSLCQMGLGGIIPQNAKEFQENILNGHNNLFTTTDKKLSDGIILIEFVDVIPAGTKLHISQIGLKYNSNSAFVKVMSYIEHSSYYSIPIDILNLLKLEHCKVVVPYAAKEITVDSKEEMLLPNEEFVEYCD